MTYDPTVPIAITTQSYIPERPPPPDPRGRQILLTMSVVAAIAVAVAVSWMILQIPAADEPELLAPSGSTTVTSGDALREVSELPRVAGLRGLHDGPNDGTAGNVTSPSAPNGQGQRGAIAAVLAAQPPPTTEASSRAQVTVTSPASGCDPNYSGCVPVASDVDCAGGGGNGPAYIDFAVRVIGRDVYDLDRNNDGIGCDKFGGPRETVPPVTTTPTTEPEPESTVPTTVETVPTSPAPTAQTTTTTATQQTTVPTTRPTVTQPTLTIPSTSFVPSTPPPTAPPAGL